MSTSLWIGLLLGILVSSFAPGLIKWGIFVVALVVSGLAAKAMHIGHSARGAIGTHGVPVINVNGVVLWLIAIAGVGFGVYQIHAARRRGLVHLGVAELNTRWANVRKISKWGW